MINEKLKDAGPPSGESAVQQIAQQVVACFTIPLLIKSVSGSFSVVKAWTIGMTPIPMVEFGGRVMTTIASGGRRALAVFNPISEAVADSAVVKAAAEYSRSAAGAVSSAAGAIADKFAPLAELVTRPVAAVKSALTSALETGPGAKITSFCAKYIGKALKGLGALVSVGVAILGVIEVVQAADLYATFRTAIGGVATNVTQVLSSLITDAQEVQQLMVANDSRPTASSLTCAALLGPQGPGGLCWTALGGHCCTPNEFKPVGEAWVYAAVADCTPSALACDRLQVTTGICHDLTQADYDAKVEGSVCESDNECLSNNCGRYQAGDDDKKCCKAGCTSTGYWGYSYCYCMEPGTPCWSDAMCAPSGKAECEGNGGGFRKGTCKAGTIPDWQPCPTEEDYTCQSGKCGRYSETSAYYCCGAGVGSGWPDDWCAGLDAGHECKHNNQCTSDYCNSPESGQGTCAQGNIAEWQPCPTEKDSTCASGKCGRYSETSAYYCCGNAGVASGWPDDWCAGLGDGHECEHDNQCTSDYCNNQCGHEDSNGCHPAGSLLELAGGEQVAIESAKVGDHVATPTGLMPIIGFLHAEEIDASYMRLSTASASMSLSALHQVFVNGSEIYPSDINIGDLLHTPHGLEPVTRIEAVKARGAYHIVVKGGAYYVDGILASDYIGDVSKASWPFVRLYVEARYLAGLPVIPIGRGYLRLSWPINLLDRAGAPPSVKHALAPFTIATCIIIELADVAAMHFLALVVTGTGIGAAAGLIGSAKRARG